MLSIGEKERSACSLFGDFVGLWSTVKHCFFSQKDFWSKFKYSNEFIIFDQTINLKSSKMQSKIYLLQSIKFFELFSLKGHIEKTVMVFYIGYLI
jgi:hypothetical protein